MKKAKFVDIMNKAVIFKAGNYLFYNCFKYILGFEKGSSKN